MYENMSPAYLDVMKIAEARIRATAEKEPEGPRRIPFERDQNPPPDWHGSMSVPRSEVVSEPGAAIRVERINLTDAERESLSINTRLSDI